MSNQVNKLANNKIPKDKIRIESMVFYGFHGVSLAEQEIGQRFLVDLEIETDLQAAAQSDDLNDTVNYACLYRLVKEVVEGPNKKLLESVAESIAQRVLKEFEVESVKIQVKKPEVPIKGSILSHVAVEIFREK